MKLTPFSLRLQPAAHVVAFSFFMVLFLASCKKNELADDKAGKIELTPAEYLSIATDKPRDIGEGKVKEVVKNFINLKVKSASGQKISIETKYFAGIENASVQATEPDSAVTIPLYKVNIGSNRSKETAIVSGDERLPVVLAYFGADSAGSVNGTAHIGKDLLLEAAENTLKHRITQLEKIKDALRTSTVKKVAALLSINEKDFRFDDYKDRITVNKGLATKAPIIADPSSLGTVVGQYGPFVFANWSKGMPYNRQMAQSCPNNWLWDNRYPISSVVIAAAHILSSYQPAVTAYGTAVNWSYLLQNDEIYETSDYFGGWVADPLARRDMVAYLMKYVGEQCQVSYTCTSSSVNFTNVSNFLNRYRIRVGGKQALNTAVLKQSIQNLKPAFMYGQTSGLQGHWWIADGMMVLEVGSQPTYNYYIHANMGEGRLYTGYYLIGSDGSLTFDASFAHFNTNLVMYPNVEMY